MGIGLQPIEPETARNGVVLRKDQPVGAACLVSATTLLTCRHVVEEAAVRRRPALGTKITIALVGVIGQPTVEAVLERCGDGADFASDIALLRIAGDEPSNQLAIRPIEFASPLTHTGKIFGVMGFPEARPYGVHATGFLRAADRNGLVQMDGASDISVAPGFSGAPVWCRDLRAFVGIVVADDKGRRDLAWCIPSRLLCRFYPELLVKFRIPDADRPVINDLDTDDPNADIFGTVSEDGGRRLTAKRTSSRNYKVTYTCLSGSVRPRGTFVTFITYPGFGRSHEEDSYELFAPLVNGTATMDIGPCDPFTVAAIGDGGDTALTVDLEKLQRMRKRR